MRALVCEKLEGPKALVVCDVERPPLPAGHLRVAVRAAGVNFADLLMVSGGYQEKPSLPFVPGMEAAGEVVEVAPDVSSPCGRRADSTPALPPFESIVGERVIAMVPQGAFAEEVVVPAGRVHALPDGISFETGAAFPIAYGTAHLGLKHRANLRRDEVLVVHGAAGGVGLAAVEVGRALGAQVIATAGSPERVALALQHGAHHGIDYSREDLRGRLKELTQGRGADVIFDPVGGDVFDTSVRSLGWEGRLLVIGFAAGRIPQVPAGLLLVKNLSVVGFYWGAYLAREPHVVHESLDALFAMLSRGVLRPVVSATYPLDRAGEAIASLGERKATGKVVIVP